MTPRDDDTGTGEFGDAEETSVLPDPHSTRRVRIIGAEQAGAVVPPEGFAVTDDPLGPDLIGDPVETFEEVAGDMELDLKWTPPRPVGDDTELPHWTDPPTGQVPAILTRDEGDLPEWQRKGDTGPVWREHERDWSDPGYEPSMLADEEMRVGQLRAGDSSEDSRPWEFASSSFDDLAETDDDDPVGIEGPRSGSVARVIDTGVGERSEEAEPLGAMKGVPSGPITTISSSIRRLPAPPEVQTRSRSGRRQRGQSNLDAAPEQALIQSGGVHPSRRPRSVDASSDDGSDGRNMPLAIATGLAVAGIALLVMWSGPLPTVVLATIIVTLCAAELYGTLRRSGRRAATLLGIAGTVGVMVAAYSKGPTSLPLVTVLVMAGTLLWFLVGVERGSPVEGTASTVLVFVWVGILGSYAALLLAPSQFPDRHGVAFFAAAIIAGALNDIGALIAGRWFGSHLLAPAVSPKKTWEGFVGGTVLTILGSAFLIARIHPWTTEKAVLLGVVVSIVAPIGDLCESLIKRDLKLKDMGSLLPGHGGMLDRFDALLFVMPATYYLVRVVHLG